MQFLQFCLRFYAACVVFLRCLSLLQASEEDAAAVLRQTPSPGHSPDPSPLVPVDLRMPSVDKDPAEAKFVQNVETMDDIRRSDRGSPHQESAPDATLPPDDVAEQFVASADESGPSRAATAVELGPGPSVGATAGDASTVLVNTAC
jgi:hypothetical protein